MKTKSHLSAILTSLLILFLCFSAGHSLAQTKSKSTMMKDCCMMKDGKMMRMKGGKMMPMDKDVTMKNGTKCMTNGECKMANGKKMMMKEGQCMDMKGKLSNCGMMSKSTNMDTEKNKATTYVCPMHPDQVSDKQGKCPKCGMQMVEKK